MTVDLKNIQWRQPIPLPHMRPQGYLPMTPEAAALWQFLVMAAQALDRVEKQVTYEGADDQQVDLMQLAHSARKMFELPEQGGLEKMFNSNLIASAKAEAIRSRLPWNTRLDAFFISGGNSYRHMDRDADKVGL
jgi:hypothetical protein